MYEHILFPTDGSDATHRALTHALDLAEQYGATLHVLSVVSGDPYRTDSGHDAATESAQRAVDAVATRVRDDVTAVTEVRKGAPHEEILTYADENGIDMLVMGTHGRTGVERALLGSVTERVVRTADVPVVTVRSTDEIEITGADDAEEIAFDELRSRGHESLSVVEEPYRTTGSWIVPVEGDGISAHVHIDATSGSVRVARLEDE